MSLFGRVKLNDDGQRRYEQTVHLFESLFESLKAVVPVNPEFTLMQRNLEMAKMWAAKAIALDHEAKP